MTLREKSNGHQKHTALVKPSKGNFHPHEWAILGTPCGKIKKLAFSLSEILSEKLKVGYVDADHKSADEESEQGRDPRSILSHGGNLEFTDKITFSRFDIDGALNSFQMNPYFDSQDLVLVNGNHFQANKQIVVIDPKKSLEKRIKQLTDVRLILLTEEGLELPGILKEQVKNWSDIPTMSIEDHQAISEILIKEWNEQSPVLKGMVLAGGKSTRMGHDKGKINYHGKDQRLFMWEQLNSICDEAFVSIRSDQEGELDGYPTVSDTFSGLGPYGAILSAFREDPNAAWMVVACDQPFLDQEALSYLKEKRNRSKVATSFHNPETDFPEPLITIWEPRAYPTLLNFLSLGYSCPRKALINSDCEVLTVADQNILKNINTPEEFESAKSEGLIA